LSRRLGRWNLALIFVVAEPVRVKKERVFSHIPGLFLPAGRRSRVVFRLRHVPSSKRYLFLFLRLLILEEPGLPGRGLRPFLVYFQVLPAKIRVPLLKGVFDADFEVLGHSPGLAYIYELLPVPAVPGYASTGAGSG